MSKSEDKGFGLDKCGGYALDNVQPTSDAYAPEKAGYRSPQVGRQQFVIDGPSCRFLENEQRNWKGVSYTLNVLQVQLVFPDGSTIRDWIEMPTWDSRINALAPWDPQQENRWGQFLSSLGYDTSKTLWPAGFRLSHLDGKSGGCEIVHALDSDGKVKKDKSGSDAVQVKLFSYHRIDGSAPQQQPAKNATPSEVSPSAGAPSVGGVPASQQQPTTQQPTQRKFPNL
jgi:hypothetical protein